MGKVISNIITPIIKRRIESWRDGDIDTLNEMNEKIKADLSEKNLKKLLLNDDGYLKVIKDWMKGKVGKCTAIELKSFCDKYCVRNIDIDDLNIMTMPKTNIEAVVSAISGVVADSSITTLMAVIVVITSDISEALAGVLFNVLMAIGSAGGAIIAAVLCVTVTVLVVHGFDIS